MERPRRAQAFRSRKDEAAAVLDSLAGRTAARSLCCPSCSQRLGEKGETAALAITAAEPALDGEPGMAQARIEAVLLLPLTPWCAPAHLC